MNDSSWRRAPSTNIDSDGNPVKGDYARIFDAAAKEADIILWDGGNNDFPFVIPNLHIVLVDPLRAGHETTHYPGEAVLRMADVGLLTLAALNSGVNICE